MKEEIRFINDKMLNRQKYSNIYRNNYELNEKILIHTNFFLSNNTIKRKSKKNEIYCINAKIIKIYSNSSYKIKVANNYKNILLKNNEYYTNITMIKKVDENVWKK